MITTLAPTVAVNDVIFLFLPTSSAAARRRHSVSTSLGIVFRSSFIPRKRTRKSSRNPINGM